MFSPARVSPSYSPRVLCPFHPRQEPGTSSCRFIGIFLPGFLISISWYTPTVASYREYLGAYSPVCPTQRLLFAFGVGRYYGPI